MITPSRFSYGSATMGASITHQLAYLVETLSPVDLAFAWTQSEEVPVLLGQINFFMEFDVCFFRSESVFEIAPRNTLRTATVS